MLNNFYTHPWTCLYGGSCWSILSNPGRGWFTQISHKIGAEDQSLGPVFLRTVAIPWQIEQVAGPALVFYGKTICKSKFWWENRLQLMSNAYLTKKHADLMEYLMGVWP